ncbi:prepilin peptidase [Defluviitalea phaphyphila]|uniref:prepilin peptidase n=1 Tax=Defluviitalea phaphyphila TaxID=1473580 RepID=UPI00072FF9EF|nr:A24 family peptidase [Defluviitalea phaphyphila]
MYLLIFFLGLIIGSFLNVCIFRIPLKQSIAFPPSHCFHCNHKLKPLDLIPIFSFLFLKGKCRYCGKKISIQYPLVEFINGIIYLLLFYKFSISHYFIFYAIFSSLLLVIAVIDYKEKIIPNSLIIFGLVLGTLYNFVEFFIKKSTSPILNGTLGLVCGVVIILIIILISRGGMGAGDMKLMGVIGLFLEMKGIFLTLFLGCVIGGVIGIILLITKKKDRKSTIPFGPFLTLGSFTYIYWGEQIINWYLSLL